MKKKVLITIVLATMLLLVTTIVASAEPKNYHGLTTIYYSNGITDQGSCCWNGNYYDYSSPSYSMDQFGLTYWQTYVSCNYNIQYDTLVSYDSSYPWMMQYNKTWIGDGMAQAKVNCSAGQTRRLHNYIQHWWQDGGYGGDGGTINYVIVN